MRVLPGSMLGKSYRAGSIAASVVRSACVVLLGINHDLRWVGGLCAPNGTSAQAYPRSPKSAAAGGSTVELLLPEHCCCYRGKPGCLWRPFWLFSTYKKQGGSKIYFFRKKKGHMGAQPWTPICPFFYTKNLFSAQLDFPPSRTAKKAPKSTWVCFHCCSSALATVFQLPQPVDPHMAIFFTKKTFFGPA